MILQIVFMLFALPAALNNAAAAGVGGRQAAGFQVERSTGAADWYGTNREKLERFMLEYGKAGAGYDPGKKPVAIFDWDNTVIKNDVYQATLFWRLNNNLIKKVPDWRKTSGFFTGAAIAELEKNCPPGPAATLLTATNTACADTILAIALKGMLADGRTPAWTAYDPVTFMPQNAWVVALTAGETPQEIRAMAGQAIDFSLKNPVGAVQKAGSGTYDAYMRVYGQIAGLITALKKNGFDVWVVSTTSQYIVEAFAARVGIAPERVIGVRPVLDASNRVTYGLQACGPAESQPVIPYRKGKRCWINKVIFGETDPAAMLEKPGPAAFAAGDSDNDAFFVKDALGLKLAINRNGPELMCNAYANTGGNWIINPMFILPLPRRGEGYRCSGFGLPDQQDPVFGDKTGQP